MQTVHNHSFLSIKGWQKVLQSNGFQQALSIPDIHQDNSVLLKQSVILAQVLNPALSNTKPELTEYGLIFADNTGIGENLAQQLQNLVRCYQVP